MILMALMQRANWIPACAGMTTGCDGVHASVRWSTRTVALQALAHERLALVAGLACCLLIAHRHLFLLRHRLRRCRVGLQAIAHERLALVAGLAGYLNAEKAKNPDLAVLVAGDKNAKYEAVLDVLDGIKALEIKRVGLETVRKQ